MKTKVLVLVPYSVPPDQIGSYVDRQLQQHRLNEGGQASRGRFDYLVGPLETCFDDKVTQGRLPPKIRRAFQGNTCDVNRLPPNLNSGAIVTPDGTWHDLRDFGWKMTTEPSQKNQEAATRWDLRVRELLSPHPDCWVVAIWAHS
jgi:hypothetical protein